MSRPDLDARRAHLSPAQRAALERRLKGAGPARPDADAIPRRSGEAPVPLSHAQRSLWLTWRLDPASPAYNIVGTLTLRGPLRPAAMVQALDALVARHEVLRTVYREGDHGQPLQHASSQSTMPLRRQLLGATPPDTVLAAFAAEPFSLEDEGPIRALLLEHGEAWHVLALSLHHIAGDGWSLGLLLDDLLALYEAALRGGPVALQPLPIQFADYASWQRGWFDGEPRERQLAYWRGRLGDEHPPIELPLRQPRHAVTDRHEARLPFRLSAERSERLRALARGQGVSLYMAVLALLMLVLHRFSGERDIRVGTPVANRSKAETHGLVGYLLNLLVIDARVEPAQQFKALLGEVRDAVLAAQAHQDLPFDLLVEALQPPREAGVHPLFQVKCTQQEDLSAVRQVAGLSVQAQTLPNGHAHFDLALDFTDRPDGIDAVLIYAEALFEPAVVDAMAQAFQHLADQVCDAPDATLSGLTLTAGGKHERIDAGREAKAPADVLTLWAEARSDDACALRDEDATLMHGELDRLSGQLARRLRQDGVGADVCVALLAERSCGFVVGLLAVMKAGGVCLPLDPAQPPARLAQLVADSGATQVLWQGAVPAWTPAVPLRPITLQDDGRSPLPPVVRHPEQGAYLIYTSGSTGEPKGVLVSGGALAQYVRSVLARLALNGAAKRWAMASTVAADLGHTVLFGALCSGGELHLIAPEQAFDPDRFAQVMAERRIDVLKIVPSHLQALLQAAQPHDVLPREALVLGGEATSWALLQRVQSLGSACRVFNHYGPTETTVGVLVQAADGAFADAATLPLGTPLAHASAQVLDAQLQPLPPGVPGELYVGGASLARGYLGRAGTTAQRFIADPAGGGGRLYRTGDRVRRCPDGSLEFLGRTDDQVKVRGYRVEPGEVQAACAALGGVREAAVLVDRADDGRTRLLAAVVADSNASAAALKAALAERLPDAMVPATIAVLPALPLTANGKLDRRALRAAFDASRVDEAVPVDAPHGEAEQRLARVWAEVLRVPQVGRHDNFFELGGDSILALQIVAKARRAGVQVLPKQLLERQTLARIAPALLAAAPAAAPAPASPQDPVPLTPVQRAFFAQPMPSRHHWNQSVSIEAQEAFDEARLARALQGLVARHEALQAVFVEDAGAWTQRRRTRLDEAWRLGRIDAAQAQRALHLQHGPLLQAVLSRGDRRLLLIAHHLVVDAVSWGVIVDDLQRLYDGEPAADVTTPFADWARRLHALALDDPQAPLEAAHWDDLSKPDAPWPARDAAAATHRNTVGSARVLGLRLDAETTERLLKRSTRPYRSRPDELLLGALARTLCRWAGRDSVRVELEGHGREAHLFDGVDLGRSVGWFTSLYPVRLTAGAGWRATMLATKACLRAVPRRGIGHGLRQAAHAQPFLTFNYLGHVGGDEGRWHVAPADDGDPRDPDAPRRAWFEVVARVRGGCLEVHWHYSEALHDAADVAQLLQAYEADLAGLVDHCLQDGVACLSPDDVPLAGLQQAELDALALDAPNVEDIYPLAPMQQGLLLHTLLNPGAGMYLMQDHYRFDAPIHTLRFEQAWAAVIERHDLLRTGFVWQQERAPVQVVHRRVATPVQHLDWSGIGEAELESRLQALLAEERRQGFDFARPPLLRLRLIRLGERSFHLVQSFHHVLMDAWCRSLLLADFFAHYTGQRSLPPSPRPYRDFIAWLQQRDHDAARRYWRAALQGFDTATPLPWQNDAARAADAVSVVADEVLWLDAAETAALQLAAQRQQLTVNTLVQAAWALVLARLGDVDDVVFGVTVAGRPLELEGIQDTVGLFIATLPLRVRLPPPATTTAQWLKSLLEQNLEMRQHEHLSLVEIQAQAPVPAGRPLFDSLFVFENAPMDAEVTGSARSLGARVIANRTHTNYPLTAVVMPGERLMLQLTFDRARFAPEAMQRLCGSWRQALQSLVAGLDAPLHTVSVQPRDRGPAAASPDGPVVPYPFEAGYAGLFEAQVRAHADRVAVACGSQSLTYAELNERANRVAHGLRAQGVRQDDVVVLAADRGLDLHTMLLGTLKAGAAFLVLDAASPPQRLAPVVESTGVRVVLATPSQRERALALARESVRPVEVLPPSRFDTQPAHDPALPVSPDAAAYVIGTSGSTGVPKGVMVTLRGMLNNQLSKLPFFALGPDDVIAQTASSGFDVSVWQSLAGLLCGARVEVLADAVARDPLALLQQVRERGVSVLQCVPALLRAMLDEPAVALPSLRWLLPTGEATPMSLVDRWFARYPAVPLVNAYGPAECADDVSLHRVDAPPASAGASLPIGRPTDNTGLHVLDAWLAPLPVGITGELYVSGAGIGRGYPGRPSLTAERFVADPSGRTGGRLYRTGDLARWREDGTLEYLGRRDQQVKVRGVRIELGEIEAQLGRVPGVRAAAVDVHDDAAGHRHLVAHVVASADAGLQGLWHEPLAALLRTRLPEHMVPTRWVAHERLPLSANGKLDRRALPAPDAGPRLQQVPPHPGLESEVAEVWAEVLGAPVADREDHFFERGGHSLSAFQVATRLQRRLGRPVPVEALFRHPVLHRFAHRLAADDRPARAASLQALDAFIDSLETP